MCSLYDYEKPRHDSYVTLRALRISTSLESEVMTELRLFEWLCPVDLLYHRKGHQNLVINLQAASFTFLRPELTMMTPESTVPEWMIIGVAEPCWNRADGMERFETGS